MSGAAGIPSGSGSMLHGAFGILAAMPEELGTLATRAVERRARLGLEVLGIELAGARVLACVGGVGKVLAARAAAVLIGEGATRGLLVVGTCGGLRQSLLPGTLLHCARAVQVDLAHRGFREVAADPELRDAWRAVVPGPEAWFLTADRPVLSLYRRMRLARAFVGPCAADMETAAAAAVASAAGVPFAGLRAVTDRATIFGAAAFRLNYPTLAGRAADTVDSLMIELNRRARTVGAPRTPLP